MPTCRRAFTLIELLVVVSIIALLASMTVLGISALRKRQKQAMTTQLMDQLRMAIAQYLQHDSMLGGEEAGESSFPRAPVPVIATIHDDFSDGQLLTDDGGTGTGPWRLGGSISEATHFRDGWDQPILFQVENELMPGSATQRYTCRILMRSTAGSGPVDDDIVFEYRADLGDWSRVRLTGIAGDESWLTADD